MADERAAEIFIGGSVPARLAGELCRVIQQQEVSLEWGDARFKPVSVEDLLDACDEFDGGTLLRLVDEEARDGELASLEPFLIQRRLPFRRCTEGRYEHDPVQVEFRPDLGWKAPQAWLTTAEREGVVPVSFLRPVAKALAQAARASEQRRLALLRRAEAKLSRHLPPVLPELPAFEIVSEEAP